MSLERIYEEIEVTKDLIKEEQDEITRFELMHYLDGLYECLENSNINTDEDLLKDFGGVDNYIKFENELEKYTLKFIKRFGEIKEPFISLIKSYVDSMSSLDDSDLPDTSIEPSYEDILSEEEFFKIINGFCISIGKEKELNDILMNNNYVLNREASSGLGGVTVFNPKTFTPIIVVDDFHYNIESMIVFIHELGHYLDYLDFISRYGVDKLHDYLHENIGFENYSVKLELDLLDYLVENNIYLDEVKRSYSSLVEDRFFNIINFYILCLIDKKYYENGKILDLSDRKIYKACREHFKDKKALKEYIGNMEESVSYTIQYGYANILGMIFNNNQELFERFCSERLESFDDNFLLKHGIDSEVISKCCLEEVKKVKRI